MCVELSESQLVLLRQLLQQQNWHEVIQFALLPMESLWSAAQELQAATNAANLTQAKLHLVRANNILSSFITPGTTSLLQATEADRAALRNALTFLDATRAP